MKNLFSVIVLCLFSALTFQSVLAQTGPSATPVTQWTNDAFEIRNPKGSLLLGSLDPSYCHIYTDRPTFAFNKIILSIPGDFGSYYQSNLVFKTGVSYYNFNGNTRMTILNSNGNVGIGATNPSEKLEVAGNIKATKFIGDGSGLTGITGTSQWSTTGTTINYSNGNVLIGKTAQTNSAYKLDVAGKIRADEIIVNTTGADFVFEPNYNLRTLAEVEAFIKANKHLPEIAPAANMQTNGANMGELQTKLLQKIEELTLYMIELKKENELMKKEIKELKK